MSFAGRRAHPASARRASPARDRLVSGAATAVGSLPHLDPVEAAALAVAVHPGVPAAPQLPLRHPHEGMIAQLAVGVPGLVVDGAGALTASDPAGAEAAPGVVPPPDLASEAWGGFRAFCTVAGAARPPLVKVQLAGPVTFGRALVAAGLVPWLAGPWAVAVVRSRLTALVDHARAAVPDAGIIAVLDEPGLVEYPRQGPHTGPFSPHDVTELLAGAMAAAGPDLAVGVHCCGPTDWAAVLATGPDLISAPVDAGLTEEGSGLAEYLRRGGWVAWGVVPTNRPLGDDAEGLTRRLLSAWCEAGRQGCDAFRVWRQAMVTPDCGLAGFGPSQAERALRLAGRVSERLRDQAVAARVALGA